MELNKQSRNCGTVPRNTSTPHQMTQLWISVEVSAACAQTSHHTGLSWRGKFSDIDLRKASAGSCQKHGVLQPELLDSCIPPFPGCRTEDLALVWEALVLRSPTEQTAQECTTSPQRSSSRMKLLDSLQASKCPWKSMGFEHLIPLLISQHFVTHEL